MGTESVSGSAHAASNRRWAIIGGNNLQLSAGSVSNAGNLFAHKVLTADTGQFAPQGGDIRAGSINVRADNSLTLSTNLCKMPCIRRQ